MNKRIILTALNNNEKLWYEQFIPFISTLKKTDYEGDIGVIDYGITSEAKDVLAKNNVLVFAPENCVSNLALDRHFSTACIAQTYHYDELVLFDADIWFPSHQFTLFENIKDKEYLYACPDNQVSGFIYECVKDSPQAQYSHLYIGQKLRQILDKYQYIWQLGLVAGYAKAWLNYKEYLIKLCQHPEFSMDYGVDTTLLNLYSAETDKVKPLHKKYNCIPNWEISFLYQNGKFRSFSIEEETVEAMHTPGDFRLEGKYSLAKLDAEKLIKLGKTYRLKDYPIYHILRESLTSYAIEERYTTLKLEYANANYIAIKTLNNTDVSQTLNALCIDVTGYSKICLSNPHSYEINLIYSYHDIPNFDLCNVTYVKKEGLTPFLTKENKYYSVVLKPSEKLYFYTDSLDIERTRTRWVFENIRLI